MRERRVPCCAAATAWAPHDRSTAVAQRAAEAARQLEQRRTLAHAPRLQLPAAAPAMHASGNAQNSSTRSHTAPALRERSHLKARAEPSSIAAAHARQRVPWAQQGGSCDQHPEGPRHTSCLAAPCITKRQQWHARAWSNKAAGNSTIRFGLAAFQLRCCASSERPCVTTTQPAHAQQAAPLEQQGSLSGSSQLRLATSTRDALLQSNNASLRHAHTQTSTT